MQRRRRLSLFLSQIKSEVEVGKEVGYWMWNNVWVSKYFHVSAALPRLLHSARIPRDDRKKILLVRSPDEGESEDEMQFSNHNSRNEQQEVRRWRCGCGATFKEMRKWRQNSSDFTPWCTTTTTAVPVTRYKISDRKHTTDLNRLCARSQRKWQLRFCNSYLLSYSRRGRFRVVRWLQRPDLSPRSIEIQTN